ncbi:MAG: hypothetical protein LUC34_02530 [Campylobacter sp.]|nr:hypothetical protein [Campylobacter sp.]
MVKSVELLKLIEQDQKRLYSLLAGFDTTKYTRHVSQGGIIFIPKNTKSYPLICTHIDTINEARGALNPTKEDLIISGDFISLAPSSKSACIGGDDRNGVYIALKLMQINKPFAFGFFTNEEVGCKGSTELSTFIDTLNTTCFIGLDRRGFNEAALYGYDNNELTKIFKNLGYRQAYGTVTDASNLSLLCNKNLACINISVGYEGEHTRAETIYLTAVNRTLEVLSNIDASLFSAGLFKYAVGQNHSDGLYLDYYHDDTGYFYGDETFYNDDMLDFLECEADYINDEPYNPYILNEAIKRGQ